MKRTLWFALAATLLLIVVLSLLVSGSTPAVLAQAPAMAIVQTDAGLVAEASGSTANLHVFRMIPFAAPPIGDLRWKPPQPAAPWQGVRRADFYSAACMQGPRSTSSVFYSGEESSSEDCLYLNVFTPAQAAAARLPVMVWVYGGSNVAGSASIYDGGPLTKKGVIVVTFNYRVGVLGFLAHPDLTKESGANQASGNYAIMDMIAALKWIQKNIAAFGGDPNNVTIFGQSAGAQNVSQLTVSPLAKGLFHRVIAESNSAWYYGLATLPRKLAAAEQQGADWAKKNFNAATIAELRKVSAWDLLKPANPYTRIIDGYVAPDYPDVTYAKGQQNDVPLLTGWTKDEGTAYAPMASTVVSYTAAARTRFGKFADEFLKVYPATTDAEALAQSYALYRDDRWGIREWARSQAKTGKSKSYLYYWTHGWPFRPGIKFAEQAQATQLGAFHASELAYVFGFLDAWNYQSTSGPYHQYTDADYKLSDTMMSYWTNFAKNGDPNGPGLPTWPVFDEKAANPMLYLDVQIQPGPVPNKAGLDFYEAFYNSLRASVK